MQFARGVVKIALRQRVLHGVAASRLLFNRRLNTELEEKRATIIGTSPKGEVNVCTFHRSEIMTLYSYDRIASLAYMFW